MILFLSDWNRFPSAIPDWNTSNRSFVRMVKLYRSMGIENHLFPLALMQPHLSGVNPFDPNLSDELKIAIGVECRYNPWYYMREILRVAANSSDGPGEMQANRGNIALYWSALNHLDTALIQPRQTGKSVNADGLTNWVTYFGATNTDLTLITKNDELRRENINRLKEMRDIMPKYLLALSKSDPDNQSEIGYSALNNRFRSSVSQTSEAAALNVGRGLSTPWLQSDEGPFTKFIDTALPAALAAGTAVREEAARAGRPYANIFTTTAGRRDHEEGKFMYDLIHNGAEWSEVFFDAPDQATLHDRVIKAGNGIRALVNITLSHRQLGKTDEWLRKAIANAGGSKETIERDFFNVWTSGTMTSPLSVQLNDAIRESEIDPVRTETSGENYMFNWYVSEDQLEEMMESSPILLGLDTSDAIGRDAIVLVATHPETAETVGFGRFNEINLLRFSEYLVNFLRRYPRSVLIPERRSSAQAILDYLMAKLPPLGIDPFKRIYNKVVDNAIEHPEEYRELSRGLQLRTEQFYNERKSEFGVATTGEIRQTLFGPVLQNAARRAGNKVRSRTLSREIRGLTVKNDRIDHKAGGHDDAVFSWLLTHWLMMYGRNLDHYGIDPARVLRRVIEVGENVDPQQLRQRDRRTAMFSQITELAEQIADCRDDVLALKMEFQIRAYHSQLRAMGGDDEVMSLDGLLQKTRDERRKRQSPSAIAAAGRVPGAPQQPRMASGWSNSWRR